MQGVADLGSQHKDAGAAQQRFFFHDPGALFRIGIWGAAGHRSQMGKIWAWSNLASLLYVQ